MKCLAFINIFLFFLHCFFLTWHAAIYSNSDDRQTSQRHTSNSTRAPATTEWNVTMHTTPHHLIHPDLYVFVVFIHVRHGGKHKCCGDWPPLMMMFCMLRVRENMRKWKSAPWILICLPFSPFISQKKNMETNTKYTPAEYVHTFVCVYFVFFSTLFLLPMGSTNGSRKCFFNIINIQGKVLFRLKHVGIKCTMCVR